MIIYLVQGKTGEYDDFHNWIVQGFKSKESAQELCNKLNIYNEPFKKQPDISLYKQMENAIEVLKEIDPLADLDYATGTTYFITEVIIT